MQTEKIHPLTNIQASFSIGERWYVFSTLSHAEKLAEESIQKIGLPVFIPFEQRIQRRHNRKTRRYEAALFPGYGFVKFDIHDDRWGQIKGADGIIDLLKTMNIPRSVPDGVIDGLKLANTMGLFDRTKPPSVGMPVEVTEGPFATFLGKVLKARTGDRVDVLLKMFGGEVSTTVPVSYLREVA